ncbi:MAG: hypothetical protein KF780_00040 [Sphingomonas sp.]|nr:hypothetical protein [Sphingomonas sp.]
MRRTSIVLAALFCALAPAAVQATPASVETKQSVCIPIIIEIDGEQVVGLLCIPQGGVL